MQLLIGDAAPFAFGNRSAGGEGNAGNAVSTPTFVFAAGETTRFATGWVNRALSCRLSGRCRPIEL